jgi:superfamily II DNA or RNA helicase
MSKRPCGVRVSKKNPDAYSKTELVEMAVKQLKVSKSKATAMTIELLCQELKLSNPKRAASPKAKSSPKAKRSPKRKSSPKGKKLLEKRRLDKEYGSPAAARYKLYADIDVKSRPCSARPMKGIKNRWTRPELEKIAMERLDKSSSELKALSMESLCKELGITYIQKSEDTSIAVAAVAPKTRAPTPKKALTPKKVLSCISNSKVPLRPYQQKVVEHMQTHDGAVVVHSTGAGKTLTSVTIAMCYLEENPEGQVIVVTPKSLIENFYANLVAYGGKKDDKRIKVMNYETFIKLYDQEEINCKNSLLIVDEAHNLKTIVTSKTGKRASTFVECGTKASKRVLLTATPLVNSVKDINNLVSIAKGLSLEQSGEMFERLPFLTSDKISLTRAKDEFGDIFHFYSPNELDQKLNYPERRSKPVFIEMDPNYLSKYKAIEQENVFKLTPTFVKKFKNPDKVSSFYMGLRMASNALESEKSPKIKFVINYIKTHPSSKILIYSFFLESGIQILTNELKKLGIEFGVVSGKITSAAKRQEIVNDFNSGKKRILFISEAGGEGLDLKGTNAVILLEPTWNESQSKQIIGRAIRYGSHKHLPEDQRFVDVIELFLVKPEEMKYLTAGKMTKGHYLQEALDAIKQGVGFPSVDNYIRMSSILKQEELEKAFGKLQQIAF